VGEWRVVDHPGPICLAWENSSVAGRFAVAGTFRLPDRGFVVFGDVVAGDARVDEALLIPLNSSLTVSARIRSVKTVDHAGRSYVGLVLAEVDLEADILQAFRFEGEELEVSAIPGRMTFTQAVEKLRELLRQLLRADELVWVSPSRVIRFPFHVYIFRPSMSDNSEKTAKRLFDWATDDCVAIRVGAIGSTDTTTFAAVWPIHELADGEAMFIHDSVKIDVPHENPKITVVNSRVRWWVVERLHDRWRRRRDAIMHTA
jgi:hypothetical protein